MISYLQAQQLILSQARSFGTEVLSIDDADGRVLAEDILADRDYPPFNRSAMDGYAINLEDWKAGTRRFIVQEIIYAGTKPSGILERGAAFKIMTGSAVPYPANAVIRREDADETENVVTFNIETANPVQNIAKQGEDLKKGNLAIPGHKICSPALISTLATLGKSRIKTERLPRIALFTTGNEVKKIDEKLSDVEIRNSNSYLIKSLLKEWKISPSICKHLNDNPDELKSNIREALSLDIIILCGGVSAGDADYVPVVLESLGVKKIFHKVAIKPGKPFWCGTISDGTMVFALPGNPFSSFVTFKLFIRPFLEKSFGLEPQAPSKGIFKGTKLKKTSFDEFLPVKFCRLENTLEATTLNGSGDIRLGIDAEALAIHPADIEVLNDGDPISYFRI